MCYLINLVNLKYNTEITTCSTALNVYECNIIGSFLAFLLFTASGRGNLVFTIGGEGLGAKMS